MPKTRAELISKAISLLQEAGAGQSIAAEDAKSFDDVLEPLVAELWRSDVAYIGNLEEIDDAVFLPLARLLMNEAGEDFGRPTSAAFRAEQEWRLRRVLSGGPLYTHSQPDYF